MSTHDKTVVLVWMIIITIGFGGQTANCSSNGNTVLIDPGHGGSDPGAVSPNGILEKDLNLQVSTLLRGLLVSEGLVVDMTRMDDTFVSLDDRRSMANRINPDLFISVHCDSFTDESANGFTVFIERRAGSKTRRFAESISNSLSERGGTGIRNRGVKVESFRVLTGRPSSVLVEMGFLSSHKDQAILVYGHSQYRIPLNISRGILKSLGLQSTTKLITNTPI